MTRTALLIGGTGPTGPLLATGLLDRGFAVEVFHTGNHETEALPPLPHLHGDPFTADGIAEALGNRTWDVVVATYGRVRLLASALAGRCSQLLVVGGIPVYRGYVYPESASPAGMSLPVGEDHPLVAPDEPPPPGGGYSVGAIRRTEDAVFGLAADGAFRATVFRYPTIYGPRNPHPWEWSIIKRVRDGRPWMVVLDGGRSVYSRCAARNAAHGMLLAVDAPEVADGRAYNVADDEVLSQRQWVELVVELMGGRMAVRSLPAELPGPGHALMPYRHSLAAHCIVDLSRIRAELGYAPVVDARTGLREVIDHSVANAAQMDTDPNLLDPFDYPAEDRLVAAYDAALAGLADQAAPFAESVRTMPMAQTAKGSTAGER